VRIILRTILFRYANFGRVSHMTIPYIQIKFSAVSRWNGKMLLGTGTGR